VGTANTRVAIISRRIAASNAKKLGFALGRDQVQTLGQHHLAKFLGLPYVP
jgi:hypothetical protein